MNNALVPAPVQLPATAELYRQATDVAGVCKEIVLRTAQDIQGRKYVKVEGWQSIATAHGCTASARDVERVEGGFRAVGEIRRMSDGVVIATAEGFVGEDEATWFGGEIQTRNGPKTLPKRPDYAIRAMAQTRAISRACRTAFAHVVVLMDAGLSTTPAEEVPAEGFQNDVPPAQRETKRAEPASSSSAPLPPTDWRSVVVPKFIKKYAGATLGEMAEKDLLWWAANYEPNPYKGSISEADKAFRRALTSAQKELSSNPGEADEGDHNGDTPESVEANGHSAPSEDVPF